MTLTDSFFTLSLGFRPPIVSHGLLVLGIDVLSFNFFSVSDEIAVSHLDLLLEPVIRTSLPDILILIEMLELFILLVHLLLKLVKVLQVFIALISDFLFSEIGTLLFFLKIFFVLLLCLLRSNVLELFRHPFPQLVHGVLIGHEHRIVRAHVLRVLHWGQVTYVIPDVSDFDFFGRSLRIPALPLEEIDLVHETFLVLIVRKDYIVSDVNFSGYIVFIPVSYGLGFFKILQTLSDTVIIIAGLTNDL